MSRPHRPETAIFLLAGVAAAGPALAQQPPPTQGQAQEMDVVTVTGSRVKRDFSSDSPIVSVGTDVLTQTGTSSIEQVLNQLPQFVPSITTTSNNPANGGQANIDLRGLGTLRNLVLMDGRRLPPSNSDGTVDVNVVPAALIDHVEVATGGASAVYGSDAIAGVTNFIMKKNFEGVALQSSYGETGEHDGAEWMSSLTMGSNFADDRGNAVFSFQYTKRDQVLQGARDFSRVQLDVSRAGNLPQGSGTIIEGRYDRASNNLHSQAAMDQVFAQYGAAPGTVPRGQNIGFNADGTLFSIGTGLPDSVVNFRGDQDAAGFNSSSYSYNFAPPNALSLPVNRWNLAGFANLDMSEHTTAYMQAFFTTYDTGTTLAPVPATNLTVPVTNPYIPNDLRTLLASRPDPDADFTYRQRMEGVGPREGNNDYSVYQLLGGLRGTVGEDLQWNVYASTAQVRGEEVLNNDVSLTRMEELLDSPTGGADECDGGYNPFVGPAGLSPACADYLRSYFTTRTTLEHRMAEATLGGTAFKMPAGDAQFSVGVSWRDESFEFNPDSAIARGDSVGFLQQDPLAGSFNMKELFGELYLPVLEDARFAKNLGFTLGARVSDHSSSGTAQSYKLEGSWQPADAVRFRSSYQRAVRAPSISELFSPANQNFPSLLEDPCDATSKVRTAGPTADAANGGNGKVRDLCVAQGIPLADVDSFSSGAVGQVETFGGGNPDLKEETADTFTLGLVLDSPWQGALSNLHASVDYYNIQLKDAIFSVPAGEIVLLCYGYAGNNPDLDVNDPACRSINRLTNSKGEPSDGTPWVPSQGTSNVSSLETAGIDFQVDWGMDMGGAGRLDLNLMANWLQKWQIDYLPSIAAIDYKGTIGDQVGSALPDYKLFFNTRWNRGPLGLGLRARYLPAMANKYSSYDTVTTLGVPSITYLDVNASWKFGDAVDLHLGVENATNEQPPLYTASIQMNTDPSTYDVLGRRYYLRANLQF
jgi:outer membrane receptor protein involved in Fe transport